MASTSGRMTGNAVAITSAADDYYFINWQLAGQNIGGNYSTINWQAYFHFQNGDAQLDNGRVNSNVGTHWHNGGRVYNYSGNFSTRDLGLASGSFTIGHDAAGNQSLNINGHIVVFDSGTSQGSAWWTLPTIPRYASITSWSLGSVTEKSINVSLSVSNTCDLVDYSINGSGWIRGYTGSFTSRTFTISNLNPATTYSIKIRVRRADSGLYTESGLKSATTTAVVVTSFTIPNTTDTSMLLDAVTSHLADLFQYRTQGSSTWNDVPGDFTAKQVLVSGLAANTTYTWEMRARHKDSQTYTPIKTASATTGDPQPLQPSALSPSNGVGLATLTPTLSWQYNATSPDSPTAYQILIRRESDGVVVYDSGKVVSQLSTQQVPASTLVYNVVYQWQVRTWSGTDITGPYSDLAVFKTSQVPVINVTNPADAETITTDAPLVTWTFADPEGASQISFRIVIERINGPGDPSGEQVYDQTVSNSSATEYLLPAGTLTNGERYLVRVFATDSDGITGESTAEEFLVSFIAPPAPLIDLELSEDVLFNRITVNTTKPADDAFDTDMVRIYKRRSGEVEWEYLTQVQAIRNVIDSMENATGWSTSGVASSVVANDLSKQGQSSLSFLTSGAGTGQFAKNDSVGSILEYDKQRVWIYALDASDITSVTFKFGTDASNYFSFTVPGTDLADTVWKSIEIDANQFATTGSPTLGNIAWKAIEVVSTVGLIDGDLLIDNWNLASTGDALFVYDYYLENNAEYEYSATAYNARENLESQRTVYGSVLQVEYAPFWNTYLIPDGDETNAMITFTEGNAVPNWATQTDTAYYHPVGAKLPTVYVMGNQKYRQGSVQVIFWDEQFGGNGLEAARKLEAIMNHKPLMFRTWWGEILYISIDGTVNIERMKGKAWTASFSFTEIGNV